ncbi:MAG: ATP-binding protein [Desulfobulbus sp.]|nr:ATP-binding protein [Desulfobulbus sp.]
MRFSFSAPSFVRTHRLSFRLLLSIIGCSLLCILLAVIIQLIVQYRQNVRDIHSRLDFIAESYVPALTASAYQLDEAQIRLELQGLLQLQDLVQAEVREQLNQQVTTIAEGQERARMPIVREYPLVFQGLRPIPVGTLIVRASFDGVYARLKHQAVTIILTNVLLIVPLAGVILVFFQLCLHRHLARIVGYTASLNLDRLDAPLQLNRPPRQEETADELDQLVLAINEMRLRIRDDMEHRKAAEQELLLRKILLECVLQARIDGICITGSDKTCLFGNRRFSDLWHTEIDCQPGQPTAPIFSSIVEHLTDPAVFEKALTRVEQSTDAVFQGELLLLNGATFEYYTVPVQASEGMVYGRLWSFRDVSERKGMEEQLRQARKMETLGSLAGGIAHDFNNLLSPIIGYAELGLNQLEPGDPMAVSLGQICKAAGRAADLTRQILAFSRKQMLEVRIIDLNEVIGEYEDMLRRLLGETIAMQIVLTPHPALVRVDPSQIEQVVLNMAVNARDAMPDGGTLTIETAEVYLDQRYAERHVEVEAGDYVMLSISDTGTGIEEAIRDRIFEPFFTTKARGKGTGLGLATSFGIIKQHHGHLWVYSEPGHGTTFKMYLPKAEERTAPSVESAPDAVLTASGSEHVLVVEDDAMVRELVCETLLSQGYRVSQAEDPKLALALFTQIEPVDLLVTDVIMPHMNGRELYRQLIQQLPGLRVLYMSGYTENVIADQGMLYEGVDFLQKPFSVRTLLTKVQQALAKRV